MSNKVLASILGLILAITLAALLGERQANVDKANEAKLAKECVFLTAAKDKLVYQCGNYLESVVAP